MSDEQGHVTASFIFAVALSLLLFVTVANLVVFQYGRGVVRAALDEGVRVGSRSQAPAQWCQVRADEMVNDLLAGEMEDGVTLRCAETADVVEAHAVVVFEGWLPTMPDWAFSLHASARNRGEQSL
jgi:hypothetical protein